LFLLLVMSKSNLLTAQGSCPVNIGFENGNFNNWTCLDGKIDTRGIISMLPTQPIDGRHSIYKNAAPQLKDTFGGFPVNCPNGSGYSIKLGNSGAGAQAQGVAYTFTIPAGENDYSIIYNYAVVLQNAPGDHQPFEQPKFTSKVFDVSANQYLECGSFQYVAAPNLPGFKESTAEPNIYYKDWAPVTIKLTGFAGKTIRLEFTVNDCTKAVHFGYAYLDVDENCTTPITGNTYCKNTGSLILKAPYGFKDYSWFNDNGQLVGSGNTLTLSPPPAGNTHFRLEIVPYPGQGCYDTLHTTIVASSDMMTLKTPDTLTGCPYPGIDITSASVIAGSTPGLQYNYFTDARETEFIATPFAISKKGTYYIKATGASGCTETHTVVINIKDPPRINVTDPAPVCSPGTMDLTAAAVTAGSDPGLVYSYWKDTLATILLTNPAAVNKAGKYFIKGVNTTGCTSVVAVVADISIPPLIVINDISSCGDLMLNTANPTAGSDPTIKFSFWQDAETAISLPATQLFTTSSTIYIKAIAATGCSLVKPVQVIIHPFPIFTVTDPPSTTRPATVDLTTTVPANAGWSYSYWLDTLTTKPILNPLEVALSGQYFIKATDAFGCETSNPVNVVIIDPPIIAPNAFSPNNDGINDTWQIPLLSYYPDCVVEIFNRLGQTIFRSTGYSKPWDGNYKGKTLETGTYYYIIKLSSTKASVSGSVTIVR
jgi:gliding motility-associated-like protein